MLSRRWIPIAIGFFIIACVIPFGVAFKELRDFRYFAKVGIYNIDLPPIAGFASSYSYTVGDSIPLLVHTTKPATATVYRLGALKERVEPTSSVPARAQSATFDRRKGMDWKVTANIPTAGLKPGLYSIELHQNDAPQNVYAIAVILKPQKAPKITVLASTNTWDAYNEFGGFSNYVNRYVNSKLMRVLKTFKEFPPDMFHLPKNRPNDAISQDLLRFNKPFAEYTYKFVENEWQLPAFIERAGYDYAVYSDRDMAFTEEPVSGRVLILNGHAEYWTPEMFTQLRRYLDRGGKVLVSAGNPLFRSSVFTNEGLLIFQDDNPREYVNRLIGTFFDGVGYGFSAPYAIKKPNHWVFSGVDHQTPLGTGCTYVLNKGTGEVGGGSGIYTQKIGIGSEQFEILAVGTNDWGPAYMVFRKTEAGGWVFNSSSGTFTSCLNADPSAAKLITNLLDEGIAGRD